MPERRAVMRGMSGSGPLGAVAQMIWLGQPAQAEPWPARVDSGPGQCSGWLLEWIGISTERRAEGEGEGTGYLVLGRRVWELS